MSTLHNNAGIEDVSKTVLMPGDPLRAKFIAENYLSNVKEINTVRNMLGYTGEYNNKKITVMGSGMGIPSMGIYSYELFKFYDVDNIIRIGSAGSISEKLKLKKILLIMGASTNSNYASQFKLPGTFAPVCDFGLLSETYKTAKEMNIDVEVGTALSSDTFYTDVKENDTIWNKMNVLAVEMESAGLYMNAARLGKKALAITTVSDDILTGEGLTVEEREIGLDNMIKLALNTSLKL